MIWVNRDKEALESGQKKPDAEVANLREAAKLIGVGVGRLRCAWSASTPT